MEMEIDLEFESELMVPINPSPIEYNDMRWRSLITDALKDWNWSNDEPERLLEPQFWKMMISSSKVAGDPNFENDDYLTMLSERAVNVILSQPLNGEVFQILANKSIGTDRSNEFHLLCEKMRLKMEKVIDADNLEADLNSCNLNSSNDEESQLHNIQNIETPVNIALKELAADRFNLPILTEKLITNQDQSIRRRNIDEFNEHVYIPTMELISVSSDEYQSVEDELKEKRGIPWRQSKQLLKSKNSSTLFPTNHEPYLREYIGSPSRDCKGDNDALGNGDCNKPSIASKSGDQNSDSDSDPSKQNPDSHPSKKVNPDPDRSPKPPNSEKITAHIKNMINNAFNKKETEVVARFAGYIITCRDLTNFKTGRQLEDVTLDFYLELIKARNNKPGNFLPNVFVLPVHCFTMFRHFGYENAVRDCVPNSDSLFNYDLVFVPLHLINHWILVVLDIQEKSLTCYDSLGSDQINSLRMVDEYLLMELNKNQPPGAQPLERDWIIRDPLQPVPLQKNLWDCGVYCLQFAEYLSRRKIFDFNQKHMTYFRKRMSYEIITCTILT